MVGQLSKYAKAKRVKLELLAGVFSPAGSQKQTNKTKNKQKTNKHKNTTHKKEPVKILAKVVKPARPL